MNGTAVATTAAGVGGAAFAFVSAGQAVGELMAAPNAASTKAVLTANAAIKTAFGTAPVFFGIGEPGGACATNGSGSLTAPSSVDEIIDLTKLASRQDLVIGFYNGVAVGAGVTGVTLSIYNGSSSSTPPFTQTFANGAAAASWFSDNAINRGSLASGQPLGSSNVLDLRAVLTVTSTSAGSGFYGQLPMGDPPKPAAAHSSLTLAQAMAGLGGGSEPQIA